MSIEVLKSGRFRATIMVGGKRHREVWDTFKQAESWEQRTRKDMALGIHEDAPAPEPATGKAAAPLFRDYAADWVQHRDLKPSTRASYARKIEVHLEPEFGKRRLDRITPDMVRVWHRALLPGKPTMRAHVYGLLRTILNSAVAEDVILANPCKIKGAGQSKRAGKTDLPTVEQVNALVEAMPGPKYQTMTLMAAWLGLRFGELTELRRKDIALGGDGLPVAVKIRRAVYRGVVDTPKSTAGVRDITIPPHIRPQVRDYLAKRPRATDTLLFPGTRTGAHIKPSSLYKPFYAARERAGVPTLRWHDLRHFSATTAAQTGASLADLQQRLGHSTVNAAMRYQHAAKGRDAEVADAMSRLAATPSAASSAMSASASASASPAPSAATSAMPASASNVVPIRPAKPPVVLVGLLDARKQLGLGNAQQLRRLIDAGSLVAVRDRRGAERVTQDSIDAWDRRAQAEGAEMDAHARLLAERYPDLR